MVAVARSSYHHGDLRAALLTAGLQRLEEGADPSVLSLRETARRAGVSAMAPYRHFADKDALVAALATVGFDMLGDALRTADRRSDPVDALCAQGQAYVAFACRHPALFRLMFGSKTPAMVEPVAQAARATFDVLAARVASLEDERTDSVGGAARDQALVNWALVHGLAMLAVDGQLAMFSAPVAELAERVTTAATRRRPS